MAAAVTAKGLLCHVSSGIKQARPSAPPVKWESLECHCHCNQIDESPESPGESLVIIKTKGAGRQALHGLFIQEA